MTLASKRLGEFEADRETRRSAHRRPPARPQSGRRAPSPRARWKHFLYAITPPHQPRRRQARRARARSSTPASRHARRRHPLRARADPQGRRRQDDRHHAARHGPGRCPRGPHHRDRRQPRPRHALRAHHQADALDRARPRHATRRRSAASPTSRPIVSRDETRLDILASDTDPLLSEAFDETTTTSSPTSPPATTRSCSPTAEPASCTRSCARRCSGPTRSSSSPAAASTRPGSPPRRSPGSRPTATATWCATPIVALNTAHPGHQPRQARRDRGALPLARARHRAHPVRPGARAPARVDPLSATSSRSPGSRPASSPRSSSTACRHRASRGLTPRSHDRTPDPPLRRPRAALRARPDRRDRRRRARASSTTSSTPSKLPGRAGVAAPQIGVGLRAFSYNVDGDVGYVINPVLVRSRASPSSSTRAASRCPASGSRRAALPVRARRRASTSTATRSCSRATASWRRRCSTRPTTSTACSTSRASSPEMQARGHARGPRERLVLTRSSRGPRAVERSRPRADVEPLSRGSTTLRRRDRPAYEPSMTSAKSSMMTLRLMLIFGVRCPLASVNSVGEDHELADRLGARHAARSRRRPRAAPRR